MGEAPDECGQEPAGDQAGERLRVEHFTTSELPPSDRHEAWRQRHWPSIAPLYDTKPEEPFNVAARDVQIGPIRINEVEVTGQHYERRADQLRSFHPDYLLVQYMATGRARGIMGGACFDHIPGSLLFADLARTSDHVSTASRTAAIVIPRETAFALGIDPSAMHGAVVATPSATLVGAHLLQLAECAADLPVARTSQLARSVLDLLVVAVEGVGRGEAEQAGAAPRAPALRARAMIERDLASPALTAASLARRLAMSRSSLHRLFAEYGGVSAYIRERRLHAAFTALRDAGSEARVGSIAQLSGFPDPAHFSRLFKARFGFSPRDVRAGLGELGTFG